jgi:hypothetical protein
MTTGNLRIHHPPSGPVVANVRREGRYSASGTNDRTSTGPRSDEGFLRSLHFTCRSRTSLYLP